MIGLFAWVACQGDGDGALDDALIRVAERGNLVEAVSEAGKIGPLVEVDIKSKVSGEILEVLVDEGQAVQKGGVLLRVDPSEYARDLQLAEVHVRQAELAVRNAEIEVDRKQRAFTARGISELEFDLAVREAESARLSLERAKIERDASRDRLKWTTVASPIDGTVIVRNIDPGEVVTAGMTAMVNGAAQLKIAQLDRLILDLDLNQVDVARVTLGMDATVQLDAFPEAKVMGRVSTIAAAGHRDETRGVDVFAVEVEVDPAQAGVAIKPGMTAEVQIHIATVENVVRVPVEVVFEAEGKNWIYRVVDTEGKPSKEKVEVGVGKRSQTEVELTSGLAEGDRYYAQADVKDLALEFD